MYSYHYEAPLNAIFLSFSGTLEGAEFDDAILACCGEIPLHELTQVNSVVADVRGIASADLKETDMARVMHFQRSLMNLLRMNPKEFLGFMSKLKIARLVDPSSEATTIFVRRLELTSTHAVQDRKLTVETLEEVGKLTGLDIALIEQMLDQCTQ